MTVAKFETFLNAQGVPYIAECGSAHFDGRRTFCRPEDIADFFGDAVGIRNSAVEHVYIACVNTANKLIGCFEASRGSVNMSMFSVRDIMQNALMIGAVSLAVCHNHPSGDPAPSRADLEATKRLKAACDLLGVGFLDHVIIGATFGTYYSMREHSDI